MKQIDLFSAPVSRGDNCIEKTTGDHVVIEQDAVPRSVYPDHFVCLFTDGHHEGNKNLMLTTGVSL